MTTESKINLKAVGLFTFNSATRKYEKQATVRLQADGSVSIEGSPVLVERLRREAVVLPGGAAFVPDDGANYLMALIKRFTDPHLEAMPLKS